MDSQEPEDFRKDLRRHSGLGIDLVANTFVGFGLGFLLDRWLGTTPWLMISGLVLGSVAGFITVLRALGEEDKKEP